MGLRVAAVVTASQERRQHYIDNNYVSAGKVSCIPLGIDLDRFRPDPAMRERTPRLAGADEGTPLLGTAGHVGDDKGVDLAIRSEEHTSELQSLMRNSYAASCLNKQNNTEYT